MTNNEQKSQVDKKLTYLKEIKNLIDNKDLDNLLTFARQIRSKIDEKLKGNNLSKNNIREEKVQDRKDNSIEKKIDNPTFNNKNNNFVRNNSYENKNKIEQRNEHKNVGGFNNQNKNRQYVNNKDSNFKKYDNNKLINKSLNEFKKSAQNAPMQVNISKDNHKFNNKVKSQNGLHNYEDGKQINKKKNSLNASFDDDRQYIRKLKVKKEKPEPVQNQTVITKAVINSDHITVKVLSEKIGKTAADIIKKLFILGNMATINSTIDFDTAELVASDFGIELELKAEKSAEEKFDDYVNIVDDEKDLVRRPPIITVMGHVDHGKTSLLDAIRKTNIVSNEAGGITQHIGAYTIKKDGRLITFIDTPGHAAFTAMRARGAMVTDIAVLVVAADDGIMPQTIEAISHIKAANVPMIVAINKIDKPTAQIERIKQQLADNNVLPEEWGGDAILVPVSAKTGEGIDKLLETMLLVADIEDLKANPNRPATGVIIEAKLDRGRGPVATVLVQNGTLKIGNTVVCGTSVGKIRAMIDDNGKNVVSVGPSIAVSVLGFDEVPKAGDTVLVVDEKLSKQIIQERKVKEQLDMINQSGGATLEDLMNTENDIKTLNLILKADVQGSVEAIKQSLLAIKNDEVRINVIHCGVGSVTETDVLLAQASNADIIAFNVKSENKITKYAEKSGVSIKSYSIIYDILDDVNLSVKGMEKPKFKEIVIGHAEVRMVYKITNVGLVAGSYVKDGVVRRNANARIIRGKDIIATAHVDSVKVFKDDVKEVTEGFECGIKLSDTSFKENDILEIFVEEQIKE